jgi:hypothetical protein
MKTACLLLLSSLSTLVCCAQMQGNSSTDKSSGWDPYPKGKTSIYKATVLNSNFTVPLIRFNRINNDNTQKGSVSFFNAIGAGIGISWGELSVTTDNSEGAQVINSEMNNTVGIQLGCLFAANTNSENQQNIFAPTFSVSVLNFQLGYGYELGTVSENQKRGFVTIAYSIPLSKLIKGGFYILRRTPKPITETVKRFE